MREYQVRNASDEGLPSELRRQKRPRLSLDESVRLDSSIAGYWSATAQVEWIVARQNSRWQEGGPAARWQDAWSAAFVSWVMCEARIDSTDVFQFAIAHHSYIQAIRAGDGQAPNALYVAHNSGEAEVEIGDLLCAGTRPRYLTLEQRRAQIGEGARTHCDIVVKIDQRYKTIDTIGGNIQSAVTRKKNWLDADGRILSPLEAAGRPVFVHLKFRETH